VTNDLIQFCNSELLLTDVMNAGLSHTIDSLFGPASQLVDITEFLNSVGPLRNTEQTVGECSAAEGLELECRWLTSCTVTEDTILMVVPKCF